LPVIRTRSIVAEREHVLIVGVGCTAFTKYIHQSLQSPSNLILYVRTQPDSREANDKPTNLSFITDILITRINGVVRHC
jgi:hypothetical protein